MGAVTVLLERVDSLEGLVRATLATGFRGARGGRTTGRGSGRAAAAVGAGARASAGTSTGAAISLATTGTSIDTGSKNKVYIIR